MQRSTRRWTIGGTAALTALLAIATGPALLPSSATPAGLTDIALTAASDSPYTPPLYDGNPEPTNPINEWFENDFKPADLAFNASVEKALDGTLPIDSLPPAEPQDALIYDIEATGNLVRGDVEALIFASEYLSHGDFAQAGEIIAPIPVDTIQGMATVLDTNLTGLAEALGIPQTDINDVNDALYLPLLSDLTSAEDSLTSWAAELPNLDPITDAGSSAAETFSALF